ncbi:uncharacterized protein LOC115443598 [Manduca sexta]|uniref:uncharacterized protein LOC115443598 n=1 Tax=Manduca sexta TaxID=7130 RepID=UPI00188FCE44|nr:uncharacterized protein LOC115443598 [Manduca sexta]
MLWDQDNVLKLIDLYHTHPVLWHTKHKHHYNRKLKHDAWVEISKVMKCCVGDLKKKIDILQAQLRREKSQMRKFAAQDEEYISSWYAYEHLKFLLDRNDCSRMEMKELQDIENSTTSTEQSEDEQLESVETENAEPVKIELQSLEDPTENFEYVHTSMDNDATSQNKLTLLQPILRESSTKRRKVNDSDTVTKTAFEMHSPAIASVSGDSSRDFASTAPNDSEAYANFIASKFRTYSLRTKNALQYEISNLLYKADNGYFESYQHSFEFSSRRSIKSVQSTSQMQSQTEPRRQTTPISITSESRNKLNSVGASLSNEKNETQD